MIEVEVCLISMKYFIFPHIIKTKESLVLELLKHLARCYFADTGPTNSCSNIQEVCLYECVSSVRSRI